MHRLRTYLVTAVLCGVVFAGGQLFAQPETPPPDQPGLDDADAPDVGLPMDKTAQLSPAEMSSKADDDIASMKTALTRVLQLQQSARKQKDIIKLNCVNEKLIQVKQLLNIAEMSRTNLTEAIANRDEGGRYHQFGQVTVAGEKTSSLRDEAEACIGDELRFVGETEVEVVKPPIPDDPTDDPPFDYGGADLTIERPTYASPFGGD